MISSILREQIETFVDSLEQYNKKRLNPRRKEDYLYLKKFFRDFIIDRNTRATEVESKDYQKILQKINQQFPAPAIWNMCIDGRVLPILVFGASAEVGSSLRLPGGIIRDFIRDTTGQLVLRHNSNYAKLLDKRFTKFHTNAIVAVFDSHVACAARLAEELGKGRNPQDGGLMADISHKIQMAYAAESYVQQEFGITKKLIAIQTSFDPHTGFLYMGLETPAAQSFAKKNNGFTSEVLQHLTQEKKIISTEKLTENPTIHGLFMDHFFDIEWEKDYVSTAVHFWNAIIAMKKHAFPLIENMLVSIYPEFLQQDPLTKIEREERSLLLLTNAFSGFLHNHKMLKKGQEESLGEEVYAYKTHEEEAIKVSHDGYPPFGISVFVVSTFDENNLLQNIDLSEGLVRKNRLEGRVTNDYGLFTNKQHFVESSVPVVFQELVHDEDLSKPVWDSLSRLSWNDLPNNWESMSDGDFFNYLNDKMHIPSSVMIAINNLRRRMALVFEAGNPISSHFIEHYKVGLPVISGHHRKVHFVVPFVKLGFS